MFTYSTITFRKALAHFSVREFRARQRHSLKPDNVVDVFKSSLHPNDRFLREASVGAGASRFLVVDRNQCVRGIYRPLLCLPYPEDGSNALGIPVESYLQLLHQKTISEENSTLVFVSHVNGFSFAVYGIDGIVRLPIAHITLPTQRAAAAGKMSDRDMRPFVSTSSLIDDLAELVTDHYSSSMDPCSSFFFLSNSDSAMTFVETRAAWKSRGYADKMPLSFDDKRWVRLPETSPHYGNMGTLYHEDPEIGTVVSEAKLTARVITGLLELDS
uniref:Uncharacterized protein n=1 Tax=Trypanosoma congolense (strain IL3000) TaxID=1068625 RepID=G0UWD8_TRYCI|nr:conserved hypothetical protein [Trypanosoma congolense IL3000]